jgi:hypothetical protein
MNEAGRLNHLANHWSGVVPAIVGYLVGANLDVVSEAKPFFYFN